jgi:hypothetical protein
MKTLDEAIKQYPDPKFTIWHRTKFPKKPFIITELFLFFVGFILTIIGNKLDEKSDIRKHRTYVATFFATIFFTLFLVIAGILFLIAWISMRRVEILRARFMGISLQEYLELFQLYNQTKS